MLDFLNSFIGSVFALIQLDWFSLSFIAFVSLFAFCFIRFALWGR